MSRIKEGIEELIVILRKRKVVEQLLEAISVEEKEEIYNREKKEISRDLKEFEETVWEVWEEEDDTYFHYKYTKDNVFEICIICNMTGHQPDEIFENPDDIVTTLLNLEGNLSSIGKNMSNNLFNGILRPREFVEIFS